MEKKERKKREAPISYRPPAELREEFAARVEKSGLNTNAFLTKAVFGQEPGRASRSPPLAAQDIARLLAQSAAIRDELTEISRGGAHDPRLYEEAVAALLEIRAALLLALGRKP